jgi:hypothetical protein
LACGNHAAVQIPGGDVAGVVLEADADSKVRGAKAGGWCSSSLQLISEALSSQATAAGRTCEQQV